MAVAALRPVDPTFESWWVRPGSATVVELRGDDRVTVVDPDGGQPAELTVLSPDGRDDPGALGVTADAPASVLRAGGDDGFLAALHARGLRPTTPGRCGSSAPTAPPGASQAFRAQRDALAIVAAPGAASSTATRRPRRSSSRSAAPPPRPAGDLELPRPLAEPRLDFRVDLASALAYEVREGEYIQIIDVKGRQCSDFLAFHRGKLERGIERGLDGVTTRTLMGNAYPTPGLQGKFYDVDMDPLVRGRARHRRAPRHLRAGLHAQVLRGHGLPRAHQLHGELQRPGHALRDRRAQGMGGAQLLLQHRVRREQRPAGSTSPGRAPATTCCCAR